LEDPRLNVRIAQLVLGLALEHGALELDRDGRRDPLADVLAAILGLEELVDRFEEALAEGGEVRPAVGGVLAVHEGEVLFAVIVRMGEGELDPVADPVSNIVQRSIADLGVQKVV